MAYKKYDDERDEDTYDQAQASPAQSEGDEKEQEALDSQAQAKEEDGNGEAPEVKADESEESDSKDNAQSADQEASSNDQQVDRIPSSQAAPTQKQASLSDYFVTREDLQKAQAEKKKLAVMGSIFDALSNRQGFGNFRSGHMNPKNDMSGFTKQMMDNADAPIQQKQTLLGQELKRPAIEQLQSMQDPNSIETQTARALGQAMIQNIADNGVMKADSPAFQTLGKVLTTGNAYQIHSAIEQSKFLQDMATQASAAKKAQYAADLADKRNDMMMNRMGAMFGNRNSQQAQKAVNGDKILNTYIPRIDGAQKILNLMDAAQSGDVKSNQAMLGQLNAEISRLETGSQSPGLGAAEKTEMNDAAAKYHDILDTVSGNVTGVDLSKKFAQARAMVKDLGGSYYDQINNRMDLLKSGALDDQAPVFEAKHNTLKDKYKSFNREAAQSSNTKVINGATYQKVQGGWKKVN